MLVQLIYEATECSVGYITISDLGEVHDPPQLVRLPLALNAVVYLRARTHGAMAESSPVQAPLREHPYASQSLEMRRRYSFSTAAYAEIERVGYVAVAISSSLIYIDALTVVDFAGSIGRREFVQIPSQVRLLLCGIVSRRPPGN